mgnify:CR=1 FL=1
MFESAEVGSRVEKAAYKREAPKVRTALLAAQRRLAVAPLSVIIVVGALTYVTFLPDGLDAPFTALPIQIFNWVSRPQEAFQVNAAAGIVVLVALMLLLNGLAIWLRMRLQRRSYF